MADEDHVTTRGPVHALLIGKPIAATRAGGILSCLSIGRDGMSEAVGAIGRQVEFRWPSGQLTSDQAACHGGQGQPEMLVAERIEHGVAARRSADHRQ